MVCIVEFDRGYRFNFAQNKGKQKLWIEILLKYSRIELDQLAQLIDLTSQELMQVYQGNYYLDEATSERLGQLLLVALSD